MQLFAEVISIERRYLIAYDKSIIIMTEGISNLNIHCCQQSTLIFWDFFFGIRLRLKPIKMLIYRQTSAIMPLNARSPKPYYYPADMNILSKFLAYLSLTFYDMEKKEVKKIFINV